MDCFLTNSKKRKVEITNNKKSKPYETEKRCCDAAEKLPKVTITTYNVKSPKMLNLNV